MAQMEFPPPPRFLKENAQEISKDLTGISIKTVSIPRPVTRILYGGGANEAKADPTTEMYFFRLIRLFRKVAIHEKL